jgi:hypothetical protein
VQRSRGFRILAKHLAHQEAAPRRRRPSSLQCAASRRRSRAENGENSAIFAERFRLDTRGRFD